jgi:hypothetical protein
MNADVMRAGVMGAGVMGSWGRTIAGMEGELPPGEEIIWQGKPNWRSLARRMYHADLVAAYFAIIIAGVVLDGIIVHASPIHVIEWVLPLLVGGMATVGLVLLFAWLTARTTQYTITTRRVVIRFGIALSAVLAIPHRLVGELAVRVHGDHTGDIPLRLKPGQRLALHKVWPHVRGFSLTAPQPMLRGVPQAAVVGSLLSRAMGAAAQEAASEAAAEAAAEARHALPQTRQRDAA